MVHEKKKVVKIVEELTLYFFALGADRIQSGIEKKGKSVVITFRANYHPDYADQLTQLEKYLNCQKIDGMEDVYWVLGGSGEPGETSQLLLVGMMIDQAKIRLEEGEVYLELFKELLE